MGGFHLFADVAKYGRTNNRLKERSGDNKPNEDLDGMERSILAKVKYLSVITDPLKYMSSEGFVDVGLRYVGGCWVWLEFDYTDQVESVKNSKVLNELFLELKDVSYDFILDEIMKRLPAKSMLRFRLLSKPWKSHIHSSKFVADHRVQKHRLFVVSYDTEDKSPKWVSIADDDTFPQRKLDLTLPIPFNKVMQIESSHGLLCLLCRNLVVLWNPTIRRSVSIDMHDVLGLPGDTTYGFGVCPVTYDPKLVRMKFNSKLGEVTQLKFLH
nr:putative F-box domain-containing protein [Tanacetum cinerariifolium]